MPRPANAKDMGTPEFIEKTKRGPVAFMTVFPNEPFNMGKQHGLPHNRYGCIRRLWPGLAPGLHLVRPQMGRDVAFGTRWAGVRAFHGGDVRLVVAIGGKAHRFRTSWRRRQQYLRDAGTTDPALLVSRVGIEPTRKTGRQRSTRGTQSPGLGRTVAESSDPYSW